jgi:hypothetical protein
VPEDLFRPSLEGAHHHAYVVENIEATVERLAEQLGAGPFFLFENVQLENITSRGEPAEFVHHSAFGYCGGGPIELMEIVRLAPERMEGHFSGAPTGGSSRREIRRLQREVGTTTVYVTHDQVEAMTMGDRIAILRDGLLEQVGVPDDVYARPANTS